MGNLLTTCFGRNGLSSGNTNVISKYAKNNYCTVSCLNLNGISFYNEDIILRGLYSLGWEVDNGFCL
jgi:hypothetical protein